MVIRGRPRGNGKQLAHYLVVQSIEENDDIHILEVAGRLHADEDYLHQTLLSMSLTSELTKSDKGLYHAQINPAYTEDRGMSENDWLEAADILGKELGFENQRRVIVLHEKKGRKHAHVVWERYDHEQGKMISDSFSRLAQDRARKEMERVFEHTPTPHRNKNRPELKEALTSLWNETATGAEFIHAVYANGYMVAQGVPDRPFMVVDETGRTFDLVRQLKGVRTKEVRARLKGEALMPEKQAIDHMRSRPQNEADAGDSGRKDTTFHLKVKHTVSRFAENRDEQLSNDAAIRERNRTNFEASAKDIVSDDSKRKAVISEQYISDKADILDISARNTDALKNDFSDNQAMTKDNSAYDEEYQRRLNELMELSAKSKQQKRKRGPS